MYNFDTFIIISPFVSIFFVGVLFLFFQLTIKKKYFINLLISMSIIFFVIIFVIYKLRFNINDLQIFYIIFAYICNLYIFMNIIQACISSVQLTTLKIIYLNPGIKKNKILKMYNSRHLFEQRLKRLESGGIIYRNKSSFFLKEKKILLVLNFFSILRKIFGIKNY